MNKYTSKQIFSENTISEKILSKKANNYLTNYRLLYDDIIDYEEKQCENLESFLPKNNFSFSDIIEQLDNLDGDKKKSLTTQSHFVMSVSQAEKEIAFLSELDNIIKTFEKSNLEVGLDCMVSDEIKRQRKETEKLLEQATKELVEREKYLTAIVRTNERKHKIHLKLMNVVKELESIEQNSENIQKHKIKLKLKKVQRLPIGTKRNKK